MSDFGFAEPGFAYALWAVLGLGIALVWLERRAGRALDLLVSPLLQPRLVDGAPRSRRLLRVILLVLSAACAVLALMRPQWGTEYVATPRTSAELMICLDVSRSMLAEDVAPNRLERAKAEIRDLLPYLEGDHVGLIAFAGRASVLSPLTPDFGFLRLVLDEAGPHSVTRGGTRLEEPIRKALAGFAASGDISRSILLITDGEDHDSFPVEAAKAAAERGVAIIAIGFGSETGSEIPLTDPLRGGRVWVRDGDGRPVISRLDGDTLRELALVSDGAYVPAGTGVLDLESIYDRHLRRLTRGRVDARGRAVPREGFRWVVLASLLLLFASAVAGSGRRRRSTLTIAPALLCLLLSGSAAPARAQGSVPAPREVYNSALAELHAGRLELAQQGFEASRTHAGSDGELRFRACYGLGYAAATRSDAQLEQDPEAALEALHTSADWYREAVRVRPEDPSARRSLEVVLQRALVLADALREADQRKLEERLDALIAKQRGLVSSLRGLLEQANAEPAEAGDEPLRRDFRTASTEQRANLSDADALAERVDEEARAIAQTKEDERTAEQGVRAAQLDGVLRYLHSGRERMGQTRRELRQHQPERAFRRGAAALAELKRAREQLADPLRVLDGLIRDAVQTSASTQLLAGSASGAAARDPNAPVKPAWLDVGYLAEAQQDVGLRCEELHARFAAGASALAAQAAPTDPTQARLGEDLREAEPLIGAAAKSFARAGAALQRTDPQSALPAQQEAIAALLRARERFLDLRGLIELSHGDQQRIGAAVASDAAGAQGEPAEQIDGLRKLQKQNLARGTRIGELIDRELDAEPAPEAEAEADARKQEQERLELARVLLGIAVDAMGRVAQSLPAPAAAARLDVARVRGENGHAVEALAALRRLFFTAIEHLKETAQRQQQLSDETEKLAALGVDPNAPSRLEPLVPRQRTLGERAGELADVLEQQSRQDPAALAGPDASPPGGAAAAADEADRLRRAAELVLEASGAMGTAVRGMAAAPPQLESARTDQDRALGGLLQAIALLEPPQQEQQDEGDEQQAQPQPSSMAEAGERKQEAEQPADPGQLLQAVQDREAQRREERRSRAQSRYESVEKDW